MRAPPMCQKSEKYDLIVLSPVTKYITLLSFVSLFGLLLVFVGYK